MAQRFMPRKTLQQVADNLLRVIQAQQAQVEPTSGNGVRIGGIEMIRQPSQPTLTRNATL